MKILTNIRFVQVAGIAQTLSSFINFIDKSNKRIRIVGVDLSGNNNKPSVSTEGRFSLISQNLSLPLITDAMKASHTLADLEAHYAPAVAAYREAIIRERPDLILVNGTYFLPWSLLAASREFSIPVIVHYHGSITKETAHWKEEKHRNLFRAMEMQFDDPNLFYIFPSNLTKEVVEKEIFGHSVRRYSILPNPVPLHFFDARPNGKKKRIGVVGRWTAIKNTEFIERLARYNAKRGGEFSFEIVSDISPAHKSHGRLTGLAKFKPAMDNERLPKFYASLSAVISPSHFETYGNVAKESLACGTPALVSSRMGVAETFQELGLQDWIIDFRSVKDTYEKIQEVSKQRVSEEVRAALREKHSSDYIHGKMVDIIRSV